MTPDHAHVHGDHVHRHNHDYDPLGDHEHGWYDDAAGRPLHAAPPAPARIWEPHLTSEAQRAYASISGALDMSRFAFNDLMRDIAEVVA